MKIFLTGSSGFIGFHLSKKLLDKGHNVHGFDSMNNYYDVKLKKKRYKILSTYKNFLFTKSDIENRKNLSKTILKFKPKIIIHLAAQAGVRYSIEKPRVYLDSNITGTYNIIELAKKVNVKHLLIASSSSVYGANTKLPFKENDKTETQLSIYAATKKSTESIAHSYSNIWKLPITMMRLFTVYGPWGRPDMAMYIFANKISNNQPISVFNHGDMIRDFTYIDDIIDGIRAAIHKNYKCEIFNLGNGSPINIMYMLELIQKYLNKKAIIEYKKNQLGDVRETVADITYSKKKLGYDPSTHITKGVKEFIKWFKENKGYEVK